MGRGLKRPRANPLGARMSPHLSPRRAGILAVAALVPQLVGTASSLQGDSRIALAGDSPLAANATRLFAVSSDGRLVLSRPIDRDAAWSSVPVERTFRQIRGLAATNTELFVVDQPARTIYRINLERRT